ncbi:MAG TPA: hypothetical protein VHA33_30840 [Candidatus Angelobacter sp.]|jgi:hypothetical protein|nr:hypothetical protein [Candidatus Angelobacter sp.]
MPPIVPKTPNLFRLHGHNLQVTYSTSGFDGIPHLQYHDAFQTLHFSGDQIRTQPTEIGTLVTVTIRMTVDSGSTAFTLLVPNVNLEEETNMVDITTFGITTIRRFSIVPEFNEGQLDSYAVTELRGTAARVVFATVAAKVPVAA